MKKSPSVELALPKEKFGIRAIDRLVEMLGSNFRVTTSKDIRKALYLSVYLISLSRCDDGEKLLKSFLAEIVDDPNSYVWGDREEGYALLAYIAEVSENKDAWDMAFSKLTSKNFDTDDLDWIVEQASEDLQWKIEEEPAQMEEVFAELTDTEIREGLVSSIIQNARHLALLTGFFPESQTTACDMLKTIIRDETQKLKRIVT